MRVIIFAIGTLAMLVAPLPIAAAAPPDWNICCHDPV